MSSDCGGRQAACCSAALRAEHSVHPSQLRFSFGRVVDGIFVQAREVDCPLDAKLRRRDCQVLVYETANDCRLRQEETTDPAWHQEENQEQYHCEQHENRTVISGLLTRIERCECKDENGECRKSCESDPYHGARMRGLRVHL